MPNHLLISNHTEKTSQFKQNMSYEIISCYIIHVVIDCQPRNEYLYSTQNLYNIRQHTKYVERGGGGGGVGEVGT